MKKTLFLLLAAALAFASCNKDNPETTDPSEDTDFVLDDYAATISISSGTTVDILSDEGATGRLVFSCDHEWMIEIPEDAQDWLTVDKKTGKSTKTTIVTFTAKANEGPSRTAACRILSGSKKKKFTVKQAAQVLILKASDIQDFDKYYKPREFDFDMLRSDSKWSWCRSKQSEHFVVFWDIKYGEYGLYGEQMGEENTWPTTAKSQGMRVDIDDLLEKAEIFYDVNINKLKFAETGKGKSVLDKHKMEIYILYQNEWLATGSGYDNNIGALWVNPSTCQPVGSTIAHEIGHCFQYMVFCDYLVQQGLSEEEAVYADGKQGPGWRYGFASNGDGGNCFWEQCAQWQSYQTYKAEAFQDYYSYAYFTSTHLHVLHEAPRYSNYFIQWWWCERNGKDVSFLGKLWRESKFPEDPCETYMRLTGMDNAAFNDDIWQYGAHMLTWDTDEIREYGKNYIGRVATTAVTVEGDYCCIKASAAPESTGYNAVEIDVPSDGQVSVTLESNISLTGVKTGAASEAGWRYGLVSYNKDGSTSYFGPYSTTGEETSITLPSNASRAWLVVSGAPKTYERHPWGDETDKNDNHWPWKAKLIGTKPKGK